MRQTLEKIIDILQLLKYENLKKTYFFYEDALHLYYDEKNFERFVSRLPQDWDGDSEIFDQIIGNMIFCEHNHPLFYYYNMKIIIQFCFHLLVHTKEFLAVKSFLIPHFKNLLLFLGDATWVIKKMIQYFFIDPPIRFFISFRNILVSLPNYPYWPFMIYDLFVVAVEIFYFYVLYYNFVCKKSPPLIILFKRAYRYLLLLASILVGHPSTLEVFFNFEDPPIISMITFTQSFSTYIVLQAFYQTVNPFVDYRINPSGLTDFMADNPLYGRVIGMLTFIFILQGIFWHFIWNPIRYLWRLFRRTECYRFIDTEREILKQTEPVIYAILEGITQFIVDKARKYSAARDRWAVRVDDQITEAFFREPLRSLIDFINEKYQQYINKNQDEIIKYKVKTLQELYDIPHYNFYRNDSFDEEDEEFERNYKNRVPEKFTQIGEIKEEFQMVKY